MIKSCSILALCLFFQYSIQGMEGTSQGINQNLQSIIVGALDDNHFLFKKSYVAHLPALQKLAQNLPAPVPVPFVSATISAVRSLIGCLKKHGFTDHASTHNDWTAQALVARELPRTLELRAYKRSYKDLQKHLLLIQAAYFMGNQPIVAAGCRYLCGFLRKSPIPAEVLNVSLAALHPDIVQQIHDSLDSYPYNNTYSFSAFLPIKVLNVRNNYIAIGTDEALHAWHLNNSKVTFERSRGGDEPQQRNYSFSAHGTHVVYKGGTFSSYVAVWPWPTRDLKLITHDIDHNDIYTVDDTGTVYSISKTQGIMKQGYNDHEFTTLKSSSNELFEADKIVGLASSADGTLLACGGKQHIKIYDTQKQMITSVLSHKNLKKLFIVENVLVSLGDEALKIWDLRVLNKKDSKKSKPYKIKQKNIVDAAFNVQNLDLAFIHEDAVTLLDLRSGWYFLQLCLKQVGFRAISCDRITGSFAAITTDNQVLHIIYTPNVTHKSAISSKELLAKT